MKYIKMFWIDFKNGILKKRTLVFVSHDSGFVYFWGCMESYTWG